jgi:RNA polymerase sigma factor (sigma-70 family)
MLDSELKPEALIAGAQQGDAAALEALVRAIQAPIYRLALRMAGDPADAQDATQEILVKVITHLGSFRGESTFSTWMYRVATNHLLTLRKLRSEDRTFEAVGAQLEAGLAASAGHPQATDPVLIDECKRFCTQGMLSCLDRDQRLAFVLGEILELPNEEAAEILAIPPATFRKRLQRARERLDEFLGERCGIADPENPCRCARQAPIAVLAGLIDPARLRRATSREEASVAVAQVERLRNAVEIFRSQPPPETPEGFVESLRALIRSGGLSTLQS